MSIVLLQFPEGASPSMVPGPPSTETNSRTGSDVTPVPSALGESLTVNRDDKTHQIAASTVIGWFLQYRRSFLVLSPWEGEKKKVGVVVLPLLFFLKISFLFCSSLLKLDFPGGIAWLGVLAFC